MPIGVIADSACVFAGGLIGALLGIMPFSNLWMF